jgi:signal transduction histidine kinase/ligand-binding sensor domain-containing protein/DNA-binding response OmpR family regulator
MSGINNCRSIMRCLAVAAIMTLNIFFSPSLCANNTNLLSFDYFSQADGLPNNQIQCIFQDRKGWVWLGTSQGLSRFDGYRFVNFMPIPEDSSSLSGNLVRVIFEDSRGSLYIGTENGGLNVFDREKECFLHPFKNNPEFKSKELSVNAITEDASGNLYIGTDRNLLKIDPSGHLTRVNPSGQAIADFTGSFIRTLHFDDHGKLWIGTSTGLFYYSPGTNSVDEIMLPLSLNKSKEVFDILKDDDGLLWVGTYSSGLLIIDPATLVVRPLDLGPYYERTETVRTISKGILGDYWIGTRGGLYIYSKSKGVTGFFRHDDRDNHSLANNSVLDIFHDKRGETWIGTRGGLNLLAKSKQVFRNFSALPNDNHFLNCNIIYAFWIDDKKRIWVGTEDGGINIYDPDKGTFEYMTAGPKGSNTLSQNCVKAFLEDGRGNLYIGTFWGGIDVLNLGTGRITAHYRHSEDNLNSLGDNRVWALSRDSEGGIWVGTSIGVDRLDPVTGSFRHYNELVQNKQVNWISIDSEKDIWIGTTDEVVIYDPNTEMTTRFSEHSRSFLEDSDKNYWIATLDNGIALYSKTEGAKRYLNEHNGLANNQALCILEDGNKNLWISTSRGLSKYDRVKQQFRNFTSKDGLRNDQFTYGAAYKAKDGELLFGGISGFNMFNPQEIFLEELDVPLLFTELRLFNRPVPISNKKDAVLKESISEASKLVLRYDQNVITLQFAALDFINSASILYSYKLEGFDKEWNEPGLSRTATYTNLNPDNYTLRVKEMFPGNPVPGKELSLQITILPPFWMTWWFKVLIILVIAALLFALIRFIINREMIKNELVSERTKARHLHELDMLKLRLFTNISHEIRTPLTLILGPLEKLMSRQVPEEDIPSHLAMVYRNTKQLDRLINQLLDFRKLETGNLKLETIQGDMVSLISNVVESFDEYAREKQITLKFNSLKKRIIALFDPDKVETIVTNLISNAIKYTDEGGTVSVHLSLVFSAEDEEALSDLPEKQFIEISVKDSGKGISQNNIEKVFTRFFRVDSKNESSGTGIGLSLVRDLVKLHNGNIYVISKPGKGSKFTVRLPFQTEEEAPEVKHGHDERLKSITDTSARAEDLTDKPDARIMLIVEDNPDVRFFIRSHFDNVYTIFEARNGRDGWETAIKVIPDVIISDILMPDVDGYEFCKRIKKDERTSHIPVLLLTALHSKEHEREGLSCGADDYVTKPFDISILQTKIENMLTVRAALKEKYTRELILTPSEIVVKSPDDRFLVKAMEVVEKNISNPDFGIESFSAEVGVSRMQLYRKLSALTNMTVKEFVRSIRLKRATQLLLEKKLTITEIAFAIGFKDLSHFRKSFHREYGMSASEYISRHASPGQKKT